MKNKLLPIIFLLTVCYSSYSQIRIESTLSAGATIVNIERLVEIDENINTIAEDWGLFSSGLSGQIFYTTIGNIGIGTEFMYQYLYWYSVRVPYVPSPIYREYGVQVFKFAQICRFGADKAFNFDIGPEINFNSDGVMAGLLCSANYFINVNDKIDIPLKFRAELMSGVVIIAPVTINAGIRLKL